MNKIIIVDIGGYSIKYGYGGYDRPIGKKKCYIENGIIKNFIYIKKTLTYIFNEKLKINPINYNIVVSIHHLNYENEDTYNKLFDIFKNQYMFNNVSINIQEILSINSVGKFTGLLIDIGYNYCKLIPIINNNILTTNIIFSKLTTKYINITKNNFENELFINNDEKLHELIFKCIKSLPIDNRKIILDSIILSGGNSLISELSDKILEHTKNIFQINNYQNISINIISNKDRDVLAWVGASILSMADFIIWK